ncbi:hypothetical protein H8R18_01365 [Nanchangia anserum]|uniref:Uncharacterized protein n=1 Tax=Nanchangia anserum TaxID=2692125 RepID=A0A8I0GH34_9ACTO|nr:hypothetical protein [Nanchangia anserum]MBD3689884.1 hypothetical protein [Nanchangia anserum]QOX82054.1 hypothetical protein H8R18_01365 [Nanchangia anserum]
MPDPILHATPAATDWTPVPLATGWGVVSGHPVQVSRSGDVVFIVGAAKRNAGGDLARIATLPEGYRPKQTQYVGATVAVKDGGGGVAACEVYTESTGVLSVKWYSQIDSAPGWTVPLALTFRII